MIISILNQKGGVGKTTLAVNLSRYFTKNNIKTLLIDSDEQGSAGSWHERSGGDSIDLAVISKITLEHDIKKYTQLYDLIFIDGIPRVSPLTALSIKVSDMTLIPVQPSPYDIWATEEIVNHVKDKEIVTNNKYKAFFIISRQILNTNLSKELPFALEKMNLKTFNSSTSSRVAYATSIDKGLTVLDGEYYGSEACREIENIAVELQNEILNIRGNFNGSFKS